MIINGVTIDDTFAEAFGMRGIRLLITACNETWAMHSAVALTGYTRATDRTAALRAGFQAHVPKPTDPDEQDDDASAEQEAQQAGYTSIRLYTNARMEENIALYTQLGYQEVRRESYLDNLRVHMSKQL